MVAGRSGLNSEITYKHGDKVAWREYENVWRYWPLRSASGQGLIGRLCCAASLHNQTVGQWLWMARALARLAGQAHSHRDRASS